MSDESLANASTETGQLPALGTESSLSPYAGPYVTEMLGRGQGLASEPYQAYTGPLTAGASDLQTQAFGGIASLNIPTEQMGAFDTQSFTADQAAQFMNPYLTAALAPQLAEARRQSNISGLANRAKLTQAGAFGGSRQAIMDAERDRNLQQNLAAITGKGYADAYDRAMKQFNVEQDRGLTAAEQASKYGLAAIQKQADLGRTQRDIETEGITADRLQFEQERDFPYKQVQYMQSLLQGLPIATQSYTYTQPTALESLRQDTGDVMALISRYFWEKIMSFGIDQIIDKKKELNFYGLPQEEMQRRAKISGKLLDALATEQVIAEKESAKNAMILAMQDDAKTVVEENEANLLGRTQQEVADGVSGVLKNKKKPEWIKT